MLKEVWINGAQYYADVNNRILYVDRDKKSGTPFSFMSKNETEQMEKELRFPRSKKEEQE